MPSRMFFLGIRICLSQWFCTKKRRRLPSLFVMKFHIVPCLCFRKVTYILLQSRHIKLKNIVESWKGSTKQFSSLSWCYCCVFFLMRDYHHLHKMATMRQKWCSELNHLASFSIMLRVNSVEVIYFTTLVWNLRFLPKEKLCDSAQAPHDASFCCH